MDTALGTKRQKLSAMAIYCTLLPSWIFLAPGLEFKHFGLYDKNFRQLQFAMLVTFLILFLKIKFSAFQGQKSTLQCTD